MLFHDSALQALFGHVVSIWEIESLRGQFVERGGVEALVRAAASGPRMSKAERLAAIKALQAVTADGTESRRVLRSLRSLKDVLLLSRDNDDSAEEEYQSYMLLANLVKIEEGARRLVAEGMVPEVHDDLTNPFVSNQYKAPVATCFAMLATVEEGVEALLDVDGVAELRHMLSYPYPEVQYAGLLGLASSPPARLEGDRALEALVPLIAPNQAERVRALAASVLGALAGESGRVQELLGSGEAVHALLALLELRRSPQAERAAVLCLPALAANPKYRPLVEERHGLLALLSHTHLAATPGAGARFDEDLAVAAANAAERVRSVST
eukprot:tig00001181_g7421.t1